MRALVVGLERREKEEGVRKETHCEPPVDHPEELALEEVELADGYAADPCVEAVRAECVAERFAGDGDGRDEEAMACQGRHSERGDACADCINVVQGD